MWEEAREPGMPGSVTSFLKVHSTAGRSNVEMADIGGIFKQGLPQYEFEHAVFLKTYRALNFK